MTGITGDTLSRLLARQPRGRPLLREFYTDEELYRADLEHVIYPNWFVAGHRSEWREPGDFRLFTLADESVILVLGDDGELRGLANVCRHRGSRVCLEAAGRATTFDCPYHGWRYGTDGGLLAARSMPDGFDRAAYGLVPVAVECVHGMVLVSLADRPPGVGAAREQLAEPMRVLGFEHMKVAARRDYAIPANWKLAVENYQECYHCATAHPEYAQMHTLAVDVRRRGHLQDTMRERLADSPLPDVTIDCIDLAAPDGEMGFGYSRTALFPGKLTGSRDGQPVAPLLGELTDYDGGASDFSFGAFSFMLAYSDHVVIYVFKPTGPDGSSCEITWLVRSNAEQGRDYDVDKLTWLWDVTTLADLDIITDNAAGVRSRFYEPGEFSVMERAESVWVEWYLQQLERAR